MRGTGTLGTAASEGHRGTGGPTSTDESTTEGQLRVSKRSWSVFDIRCARRSSHATEELCSHMGVLAEHRLFSVLFGMSSSVGEGAQEQSIRLVCTATTISVCTAM